MAEKKEISSKLNVEDIKNFLRNNPSFLNDNPELLMVLTAPDRTTDDGVVDFQNMMIEKLKSNLEDIRNSQGHLIDTSRNNLTTQVQVHEAVLALLDTDSIQHIGHIVTQDWPDMLHIDVIRICFEKGHANKIPSLKEVAPLSKGHANKYLGKDDIIQLRGDVDVSEEIFGPAKSLVKAEALVRIPATDHNPPGILSFGSRDADMFYPGQGTELLRFLGKSFHKCLIQWQKQKN
ncbi:MAG: DUF484 family protein [Emcibacteraceae bacterium]|jgi:uncharacterized protein YigA (DUF484 family)|uniref:DUF484 family protein n=1 Tax=Pseudemcibacter sp. TaxID=2943293 RepID=UPI00231CFA5D|nr:DUF484 family protein [Emcibacteraceae bacterium]MDC1090623.1 DUF484 family protein [Emcibacteraceae bacterium]MDG1021962.1 DUF484 family protein [Emcibacteraceae bacterium]MDG1726859.1 DUF484 family protein [Emcibacteraceae bacterium]